jgi:hypothetical protein
MWFLFALSLVVTAYAIAIKRLGNIFKVILGALIFRAKHDRL